MRPAFSKANLIAIGVFAVATAVGLWGMSASEVHTTQKVVFAIVAAFSICATCLCVWIPLAGWVAERSARKEWQEFPLRTKNVDYIARHSVGDRIKILLLELAAVLLSVFFWAHPGHWVARLVSVGFVIFLAFYGYRTLVWAAHFSEKEISVRFPPFPARSKSYKNIEHIRMESGRMVIEFEDGGKISIWKGCGDRKMIASILARNTGVVLDA